MSEDKKQAMACDECSYVFTAAEIATEDKNTWGHPCHGVNDEPNTVCESFRAPVINAAQPSLSESTEPERRLVGGVAPEQIWLLEAIINAVGIQSFLIPKHLRSSAIEYVRANPGERAAERERCAKICEDLATYTEDHKQPEGKCGWREALESAAAAIRATTQPVDDCKTQNSSE